MMSLDAPEFSWIADALSAVLLAGLLLALITSLLLLLAPARALALNARLSRWVDTRRGFEALEAPRHWERFYYRHHRPLGGAIVIGAAYVLFRWASAYDRQATVHLLPRAWISAGLDWVVPATEGIVVGLHVLALAVGLVVLLRPSLLRPVERAANTWYEPAKSAAALDRVIDALDRRLLLYPRLSGFILLLGSGWALAALAPHFTAVLARG